MSRIKKVVFILIGISLPLSIAIVILELLFGNWLTQDPWFVAQQLNIIRNEQKSFRVDNIYGHDKPTVTYTRDGFGLRGECTDPKEIQLVTIGGSTTDQRFIGDGETWQAVLQRTLSEKRGKKFCVSNAGVDGHSTFGHLASFDIWFPLIPGFKPKYYLLYIGINDAPFRGAPNDFDMVRGERKLRTILRNRSVFYRSIRLLRDLIGSSHDFAFAGHSVRPPSIEEYTESVLAPDIQRLVDENTSRFAERLQLLLERIHESNGRAICVSQPHRLVLEMNRQKRGVVSSFTIEGRNFNGLDYDFSIRSLNSAMREICAKQGDLFVDIYSKPFLEGDFYDVVHNTPQGTRRVGQYMFEALEASGIFVH